MKKYLKIQFFILVILIFSMPGCRKWKVEHYPNRIIGMWKWILCPVKADFFKGCWDGNEIYLENGTWFTIIEGYYYFEDKDCDCMPLIDEEERSHYINDLFGNDPVSDTLNYYITENILIRQRHESLIDKTTPIVTDTLEIIKFTKLFFDGGFIYAMYLSPQNISASELYDIRIGDIIDDMNKFVYSKFSKKCECD